MVVSFRLRNNGGTDLLVFVGRLVGGVRVFLLEVGGPTGLPLGPFCLLLADADMIMGPVRMRRA